MHVLSLFDGMACGMIAMQKAGLVVDRYDAYEIDKFAVKTALYNFPQIQEHGDVFQADFKQYKGVDILVGGSPCTYWSIAQKNNRETVASGLGWELFSQYVRALNEAQPKYIIYENNKSMSQAIRDSITKTFGFEPVCINSALVSAQKRQRLYWVGVRNTDGIYKQVFVEQPEDRNILLKDILDNTDEISLNTTADKKAQCLRATCYKDVIRNLVGNNVDKRTCVATPVKVCDIANGGQGYRVYSVDGKAVAQTANGGGLGANTGLYAVPVQVQTEKDSLKKKQSALTDAPAIFQVPHGYNADGIKYAKAPTLTANGSWRYNNFLLLPHGNNACTGTKDKPNTVYTIKDGLVTIKDKQYPIKLADGYYIIRKLTVSECKRLQTVPENYVFPVSDCQAYKMLGNGWTCDVIAHIINSLPMNRKGV